MKIGLTQRVLTYNRQVHDSLEHNWYRLLKSHELIPIPNRDDLDYKSLPPDSVQLYTDVSGDCESWIKDNICAIVWHPERMTTPYIPKDIVKATGL
jgi:hypothetical protein